MIPEITDQIFFESKDKTNDKVYLYCYRTVENEVSYATVRIVYDNKHMKEESFGPLISNAIFGLDVQDIYQAFDIAEKLADEFISELEDD